MKLEYLYCKESLEDTAKIQAEIKTAQSMMTPEEREAEARENVARFNELWARAQSRKGYFSEGAFKIYKQLVAETKVIAREHDMDLKAGWSRESGWIELACDILLADSTANPLHLHLGRLFERCNSYSFMTTHRYGEELVKMTFHFSFITYPPLDEMDEYEGGNEKETVL